MSEQKPSLNDPIEIDWKPVQQEPYEHPLPPKIAEIITRMLEETKRK